MYNVPVQLLSITSYLSLFLTSYLSLFILYLYWKSRRSWQKLFKYTNFQQHSFHEIHEKCTVKTLAAGKYEYLGNHIFLIYCNGYARGVPNTNKCLKPVGQTFLFDNVMVLGIKGDTGQFERIQDEYNWAI